MRLIVTVCCGLLAAWHTPAQSGGEIAVSDSNRPLILEAREADGMVEVSLRTNGGAAQTVSYALQVAGGSRTTHQGRTRIAPGPSHTLSTVRIAAKPNWGVRLTVDLESGARYEQVLGDPAVL